MSDALPEPLVTYLLNRDAQRVAHVAAVLGALTGRERALVKEAAVMGYVQGMRHPAGEKCPPDRAILAEVIDACLAFPDLYPTLSADPSRAPYIPPAHHVRDDGVECCVHAVPVGPNSCECCRDLADPTSRR